MRGIKVWSIRVLVGTLVLLVLAALGVWLTLRASLAQLDGTVSSTGLRLRPRALPTRAI